MSIGSDAKLTGSLLASSALKSLVRSLPLAVICLSGCHVIGLPSYRYGSAEGQISPENGEMVCEDGYCSAPESGAEEYRSGILPPMPAWLAEWHMRRQAEEELPEAPEYPRFHPLPTRPMFESRPADALPPQMGGQDFELTPQMGTGPVEYLDESGNPIHISRPAAIYGKLSDDIR